MADGSPLGTHLQARSDAVGNLAVFRPGSGGGERAPAVCVQGHIDMVTEADRDFDFERTPLSVVREGDWVTAEGTTLGADNGIGVAAALALLDSAADAPLPPLEALFTVDEETGLTGAFGLDAKALGITAKKMLNLDTEEWGSLYVGCAGGGDSILTLPVEREACAMGAPRALEVRVSGCLGGHSGLNIGEDRANALLLAACCAEAALRAAGGSARLDGLSGGDKRNAIARDARAVVVADGDAAAEAAMAAVSSRAVELKEEYGELETGLTVDVAIMPESEAIETTLSANSAERLLSLLSLLPHGVDKYSHAIPGLVETSNNVASAQLAAGGGAVEIVTATRSSLTPALERVRRTIRRAAERCGGSAEQPEAYPGWAPNPTSELLGVVKGELAGMLGAEPEVKAIHAGLECGMLGAKCGGMDAISYGPTITGAHSPDERVQVSTVAPFYELTERVLAKLAKEEC